MSYNNTKLPLLLDDCTEAEGRAPTVGALGDAGAVAERVRVTTARMQEVEQCKELLPRRIKSTSYITLIPAFSFMPCGYIKGEGAITCVDTYGCAQDMSQDKPMMTVWFGEIDREQ